VPTLRTVADAQMKYRNLRIAWSVTWGVVAVLLGVLWVRSYWWNGSVEIRLSSTRELMVMSVQGYTYWGTLPDQGWNWNVSIEPLDEGNQTFILTSGIPITTHEAFRTGNLASNTNAGLNWRGRFGFGLSHRPDVQFVSFPHWFLVLLSAVFATAPWLDWRYSLRTLLIATTLVALMLGVIVYAVK
jgi:hypothetical protein